MFERHSGFVGGTPVQNVGAYGQDVSELIVSVRCLLIARRGEIIALSREECGFAYRSSILNTSHRDAFVVLNVEYELREGGEPKIVYKDLIEHFEGRTPDLAETRRSRARHSPVEIDDHRIRRSEFPKCRVFFQKSGHKPRKTSRR